ncbi:unnamed protein product, partial [marine sediment metagenome]
EGNVIGNAEIISEEGKIKLKANKKYTIKVEYFEKRQNASIRLFWSGKSQPKEIIPRSQLYPDIAIEAGNGLKGIYKSMKQYIAYAQNHGNVYAISLEWPEKELVLNIPQPSEDTKVSLMGREGLLPWRYENGKMYIDISPVKFNEMPSFYAWTFRLENFQ